MKRVIVKNVCKEFNLGSKRTHLLRFIINLITKKNNNKFKVLNNVSLEAKDGEIIGIIGRNGCGKSTLLRTISGVYNIESGHVTCKGKVFLLSGLSNGLKDMLTTKENIYLVGTILGLKKKEIDSKYEDIIEFSGLKEFENVMLLKFSSGMKSRLAFSITINCISKKDPEILLLDEVFAGGGDEEFKQKSLKKIEELIKSKATVLMVSHSMSIIRKYSDKVIWMEKGKIVQEGKADVVVKEYIKKIRN